MKPYELAIGTNALGLAKALMQTRTILLAAREARIEKKPREGLEQVPGAFVKVKR